MLLAVVTLGTGCPKNGSRTPGDPARPELPALEWTIQLEGNPWPLGILGDTLYVGTYRQARAGFLFPIQLAAYAPADGKRIWSAPIRPWLGDREVPWSFRLSALGPVIGTWVKGDVVRMLRRETGEDAWSLPRCHGLTPAAGALWAASGDELILLDPARGRELGRVRLPARITAPPVRANDHLVVLLQGPRLAAIKLDTRRITWQRALQGVPEGETARPRAVGALALLPYRPAPKSSDGAVVQAYRVADGQPAWRARVPPALRPARAALLERLTVTGDLLIWPEAENRCLRAFQIHDGAQRFRACGIHTAVTPARWKDTLFVLGDDANSREARKEGAPWYTVDFPLLEIDVRSGKRRPVRATGRGGGGPGATERQPVRALRLTQRPLRDGVLYLVQRNKFLTAVRVGYPAEPEGKPARESPRESPRGSPRESPRELPRESPREPPREPPRGSARDTARRSHGARARARSRDRP